MKRSRKQKSLIEVPMDRTNPPIEEKVEVLLRNPRMIQREINNRSFYHFLLYFWPELSLDELVDNWHIKYLCDEVQTVVERVGRKEPKLYDLIINVPPGSTKTTIISIALPIWAWTRWYWMRFITGSYSGVLSLEAAEKARDLLRSDRFKELYPELSIKEDKDTKSNYAVMKRTHTTAGIERAARGGNRYSTSVGGTLTGMHGHVQIIDDPVNPKQAQSEKELQNALDWMDNTLSTRKVDKLVTPLILVMQRLHESDPTNHLLNKNIPIRHICIPGEIKNYEEMLNPPELKKFFTKDGLMDPVRMPWSVLKQMEEELGQYGYAGQVGQNPAPPSGGMFKIDRFQILHEALDMSRVKKIVRYWDKAGTADGGAYTVGVKMARLKDDNFVILDVKRGQWSTDEREKLILNTAIADGRHCFTFYEQEPGSGGKESAEHTTRMLAKHGYRGEADRITGDKIYRADPWSVRVNSGMVSLLYAAWNKLYIEEHKLFPVGSYKDQVDASSGALSKLIKKRTARKIY